MSSAVNSLCVLSDLAVNFPAIDKTLDHNHYAQELQRNAGAGARPPHLRELEPPPALRLPTRVLAWKKKGSRLASSPSWKRSIHVGPQCLGDLARRILTSSGNLTLVIDNLQKRGLVKRQQQGKDKRFVLACITPQGEKLIARIFPEHARRITEVMGRLKADEQEQLGASVPQAGQRRMKRFGK